MNQLNLTMGTIILTHQALPAALALANEVEALSGQYLRACQVGQPVLLNAAEMREVLEKFKDYGSQA